MAEEKLDLGDEGLTQKDAMKLLGSELRARRKGAGKTIQQFAFELGISDRQLRRYERGRCFPPEFRLKTIARLLNLEPGFFVAYFRDANINAKFGRGLDSTNSPIQSSSGNDYIAGTFSELIAIGYSEEWLLSEAVRLERTYPADEIIEGFDGSNDMGDDAKWNALMSANADTAFVVIRNDRVIAYWFCLPVSREIYDRARTGENINAEISLNDVAFFDLPQDYDVYFVDLYQISGSSPWVVNKMLLDAFLNLLRSLAENGFFVRRICTHAYATETERLCVKSGFNFVSFHKHHARLDGGIDRMIHTKMFEIDFTADPEPVLLRYDEDLQRMYQSRFHSRPQRTQSAGAVW